MGRMPWFSSAAAFRATKLSPSPRSVGNSQPSCPSQRNRSRDSGLKKVIDGLDEKYRTLIDLAYFQGYSQRELEKKLDIPLGTIKSRLRQAINQFLAELS